MCRNGQARVVVKRKGVIVNDTLCSSGDSSFAPVHTSTNKRSFAKTSTILFTHLREVRSDLHRVGSGTINGEETGSVRSSIRTSAKQKGKFPLSFVPLHACPCRPEPSTLHTTEPASLEANSRNALPLL